MKNLLYKEWKLAAHPTMYFFPLFGAMLLIPAYPYYVAFMYTCLSIFLMFMTGRETHDVEYTALLPVGKRDPVRARCLTIGIVELFQILFSIPFAILSARINPAGNAVGIEVNAAFYGLVLVMYAVFNALFVPIFYKTGYAVGKAFLIGGSAVMVYIAVAEAMLYISPALRAVLDTRNPASLPIRLGVLLAGAVIYVIGMLLTIKVASDRFERVDL